VAIPKEAVAAAAYLRAFRCPKCHCHFDSGTEIDGFCFKETSTKVEVLCTHCDQRWEVTLLPAEVRVIRNGKPLRRVFTPEQWSCLVLHSRISRRK